MTEQPKNEPSGAAKAKGLYYPQTPNSRAAAIRINLAAGFSASQTAKLTGTDSRYVRTIRARTKELSLNRTLERKLNDVSERVRTVEIMLEILASGSPLPNRKHRITSPSVDLQRTTRNVWIEPKNS